MHTAEELKARKSKQDSANLKIFIDESTSNIDQFPKRVNGKDNSVETSQDKKAFFHQAGTSETMSADWRVITNKLSPLVKQGGIVVDLGENSGRYAEFLAKSRPDIKTIYAIEPDKEKFALAQANIKQQGLEGRITLLNQPIAEALKDLAKQGVQPDAITSIYRTHLKSDRQNGIEIAAVGELTKKSGASFVSIDLHRPKLHSTAELMAEVYPAETANSHFRKGYVAGQENSLRADEAKALFEGSMGKKGWSHDVMNVVGQLQMHVMEGPKARSVNAPAPRYPPTAQEYIDVAESMELGFKMSSAIDVGAKITGNLQKTYRSAAEGTNAIADQVNELSNLFSNAVQSLLPEPSKTPVKYTPPAVKPPAQEHHL